MKERKTDIERDRQRDKESERKEGETER